MLPEVVQDEGASVDHAEVRANFFDARDFVRLGVFDGELFDEAVVDGRGEVWVSESYRCGRRSASSRRGD